jgi:broad specificity phosphatase PhoE
MQKIVNVKIIRHSHSTANHFKDIHGYNPTDDTYRNSGLSGKGVDMINNGREKIKEKLGNSDIILLSPLKRAIQTFLLLYNDEQLNKKVRIVPIFSEMHNLIENKGVSRSVTKNDPDINKQRNFKLIDFTNSDDALFYYDFGWKKIYEEGWKNDPINRIKIISNIDTWQNLEPNGMYDIKTRIDMIKKFLSSKTFTGKNILIFSHCMTIHELLGRCPNNLGIGSFTFNQDTQTMSNVQIVEPSVDHRPEKPEYNINKVQQGTGLYKMKYLKYKKKYLNLKNNKKKS